MIYLTPPPPPSPLNPPPPFSLKSPPSRPDMTFTVDRALKTNYPSILLLLPPFPEKVFDLGKRVSISNQRSSIRDDRFATADNHSFICTRTPPLPPHPPLPPPQPIITQAGTAHCLDKIIKGFKSTPACFNWKQSSCNSIPSHWFACTSPPPPLPAPFPIHNLTRNSSLPWQKYRVSNSHQRPSVENDPPVIAFHH